MTLQNKIDFAVILRVKNANPNGDPLNGNRPRTDYSGVGEITDVAIKRKIRDRLLEKGYAIFVQSDDRKNDDATSLQDRADKVLGKNSVKRLLVNSGLMSGHLGRYLLSNLRIKKRAMVCLFQYVVQLVCNQLLVLSLLR